jgi:predicted TIM-barrel fold metal-dependent hydrolase
MVAGLLPAVTYNRRPYGSLEFCPIFREAEELGCVLAIQGSPQSGLGLEIFDRHIEAHVLSHPLPIAMHCISIVLGGVIEKFPKLRVVFLEASSSWVPFLMSGWTLSWNGSNRVSSGAPQRRRQFQKCRARTLRQAISTLAARPPRSLFPGSRSSLAPITSYSQPTSRILSLSSASSKKLAVLSSAEICRRI